MNKQSNSLIIVKQTHSKETFVYQMSSSSCTKDQSILTVSMYTITAYWDTK